MMSEDMITLFSGIYSNDIITTGFVIFSFYIAHMYALFNSGIFVTQDKYKGLGMCDGEVKMDHVSAFICIALV